MSAIPLKTSMGIWGRILDEWVRLRRDMRDKLLCRYQDPLPCLPGLLPGAGRAAHPIRNPAI